MWTCQLLRSQIFSQNGVDGAETRFRTHGGEIIDLSTRKKSAFIRKRGVYFIKMFYKPDQRLNECPCDAESPDFTRPGTPCSDVVVFL